jgi:hypothetical protein
MSNSLAGCLNGVDSGLPESVLNIEEIIQVGGSTFEEVDIDEDEEMLWEMIDDILYERISNWRNDFSISTIYHKLIHLWAECMYEELSNELNSKDDLERGLYHYNLLNYLKDCEFKVENHDCVYIFINNVVKYLGEYLNNIEEEYDQSHKQRMRWNIAELISLDYYEYDKNITFNIYKNVSFKENKYCKSYGQVFKMLTEGKWNVKHKNKKIYPKFNYPSCWDQYVSGSIVELFEENNDKFFESDDFRKYFNNYCLKKGVKDKNKISEFFDNIKNDEDLRTEIFCEFIDNRIDYEDNLYRYGYSYDEYRYKFYLNEEEKARLKQLTTRQQLLQGLIKIDNLPSQAQELEKNHAEIKRLNWIAEQWSYYPVLSCCILDKSESSSGILVPEIQKML